MNYSIDIQSEISGEVFVFDNIINAERFLETILQKQIPVSIFYGNKLCSYFDTMAQNQKNTVPKFTA